MIPGSWIERSALDDKAIATKSRQIHPRAQRSQSTGLFLTLFVFAVSPCYSADPIIIGSKKFTESYVLGEIAKRSLENAGVPAEHRQGMGGTIILWEALRAGQIGLYPEYTGTISEEILKKRAISSVDDFRTALSKF